MGVADPTRLGRLPAGTPYYQPGDASHRMQNRKYYVHQSHLQYFGPLTRKVKFSPLVFEVTGAFGYQATKSFRAWCKEAAAAVRANGNQNCRMLGLPHTWNTLKFSNLYSQMISFSIVSDAACAVIAAVEKCARSNIM